MTGSWMPLVILGLPLAGAGLPALAERNASHTRVVALAIVPVVCALACLAWAGTAVFDGQVPHFRVSWIGSLDLAISLRLDGLSLLFAGLILGIGILVLLYARYYLGPDEPFRRFCVLLLLFMGAMTGIALSDDLLLLVLFWESTSLASFLLVGFRHHRPDARAGARMALTVTGLGGLSLLAGVMLLHEITGTSAISELNAMGTQVRADSRYGAALALVLLGAFTKSAQVPFHFWLPGAMAAPTPVSAYLHSATMVKAGVFLLARLYPALAGSDAWFYAVGGTGLATLVFAAWQALFRHDVKSLLAYSTISHLGLLMLLLGLNSPLAAVAAVFHVINHATFKASLFMAAGIIDHETGTRDMRRINGLWRHMPATAWLATVAAGAMAGIPFLNGFLSKEMLFAETLSLGHPGMLSFAVPAVVTLAGVFGVAYSTRFVHDVFFNGEPIGLDRTPHDPPRWMRVPVEVLVVLCILVGVAPAVTVGPILDVAARGLLGAQPPGYSLAIWHGFTAPLAMSVVAFAGGGALYFWLQKRRNLHGHVAGTWTGHRAFEWTLGVTVRGAAIVLRLATTPGLRAQVSVLLAFALAAAIGPFVTASWNVRVSVYTPINGILAAGCIVLVVAAAATVVLHRERLAALILVSAVGLMIAGTFAYASAPDLALTQLVVEAATVLLMLSALPHLSSTPDREPSRARRLCDGAIAAAVGLALATAAWWMMTRGGTSISSALAALAVPGGGGTNVVNVILVDFRGFDTFGEITVLVIGALGISAMLSRFLERDGRAAAPSWLPVLLAHLLVPLSFVLALHLFLRGHQLPGGGFVAGLVVGGALVFGAQNAPAVARVVDRIDASRLSAIGLVIASVTGLGAWGFGRPFLTSAHGEAGLGVFGTLHWASAALFDLGVSLVVAGIVLGVLTAMDRLAPETV
ncbi:MAG: monovalent cation/H+ antiporter subunit A [Burkholderiales bacterium]